VPPIEQRSGREFIQGLFEKLREECAQVRGCDPSIRLERSFPRPSRARDDGSVFSLRKWYLDCVAESGDLCIAYRAELRVVGAGKLTAASFLRFDEQGGLRTRWTVRSCPEPSGQDVLTWEAPALGVAAQFRRIDPSCGMTLLDGPDGAVRWTCLHPRADVEMRIAGGVLRGAGYAEVLELTVPPWKLPIDELRWGRLLTRSHGLVWIEWRGPHPQRIVLLDGRLVEAEIEEHGLRADGAQAVLGEPRVLRAGRIGETVLSAVPGLEQFVPGRILGLAETKWRSRGRLRVGSSEEEGWAIHELVRWPH
jgi:hypothetical protein